MLQRIGLLALLSVLGIMVFFVPWLLWLTWPEDKDRGWYVAAVYLVMFDVTIFGLPAVLKLKRMDAPTTAKGK